MRNYDISSYRFAEVTLWALVILTALLALAVIVIIAYHIASKRNDIVSQRRRNIGKLVNYILITGMIFLAVYITLVSASGQYRDTSQWFGFALVGIGIIIAAVVCTVGYILAVKIWNRAHLARSKKNNAILRARTERDYFIRCLDLSREVIDLNPYAEDLPPAND